MSYTFKTDKRQTPLEQKLVRSNVHLDNSISELDYGLKCIKSALEDYKKIQVNNELDSSTIKKIESMENFVKEFKPLFDKLYFDCNITN